VAIFHALEYAPLDFALDNSNSNVTSWFAWRSKNILLRTADLRFASGQRVKCGGRGKGNGSGYPYGERRETFQTSRASAKASLSSR